MTDPAEVTHRLNIAFKKLLHQSEDGGFEPHICSVCDSLLICDSVNILSFDSLKQMSHLLSVDNENVNGLLKDYYRVDGRPYDSDIPWDDMFLSPKTRFIVSDDRRQQKGIACCVQCEKSLKRGVMPKYAIANGFFFGAPPSCLEELTEVELAFVTPVKTHGYVFSYSGGYQKELKGSLSYYKVKPESIARATAHFSVLGLESNIVVLLYGKMTPAQREKARKKNKIRTNYVMSAIEWLSENNSEWSKHSINLDHIASNLRNPTLVDNTIEVDGSDNNIESRESYQVFFPDGAIDVYTGGKENVEEFREMILNAKRNGFNIEIQADLMRTAVSDYKDNNLVNACLLQFPFGRGGLNERRQIENGRGRKEMDLNDYVTHLSKIRQPQFHHELFVLILYNMKMKLNMLRGATWRVRNTVTASMLATELCEEDIEVAIRQRRSGHSSNGRGEHYLKALDAVARGVPHTNEAAKRARRDGECLQHHFGLPTIFLTVTPDDDNSLLVEVISGLKKNDAGKAVDDMSDSEIEAAARERTEMRIRFPGVCAYAFDALLKIIIREVIGWDVENGRAFSDRRGLFGTPVAFTASVEEQGRKTLHVHIQIWIKELMEQRKALLDSNTATRRAAKKFLCREAERTMTTKFMFADEGVGWRTDAFPHECTRTAHDRCKPVVVNDQRLRELRYKDGNVVRGHTFACCPHCPMTWTYENMVRSYVQHGVCDVGFARNDGEGNLMKRMKAKALEYQQSLSDELHSKYVIEAGYNWHCHTKSCFQRAMKTSSGCVTAADRRRAKKRILECECRYRLPCRKKRKTIIQDASSNVVRWYNWRGTFDERRVKELCLKRNAYDLYQNQSCPSISHSKFTCNTNVSMMFYGSTGQYSFKYCMKNTQADDREEFDHIIHQKDRILGRIRTENSDRAEATRRLLVGSFAHQHANVCGGPLSSYLTRNKERFIFSHGTVWIPLRDIESLLIGRQVSSTIMYSYDVPFFQCSALHYLTRPAALEQMCSFEFYSKYEVIRITKKNVGECMQFRNTDHFRHPSFIRNRFLQGVREAKVALLSKVFQYDFPDTAQFGGDILSSSHVCEAMESYAKLVLLLFHPYREHDDLICRGSYTYKLRLVFHTFKEEYLDFLQNVQDSKSNCLRNSRLEDDLQRVTVAVTSSHYEEMYDNLEDDDSDENDEIITGAYLDQLINELEEELAANTVENSSGVPHTIALEPMKDKGRLNCGYSSLAKMTGMETSDEPLISHEAHTDTHHLEGAVADDSHEHMHRNDEISKGDIVRVILERTSRNSRSFFEITGQENDVDVLEANGTVCSIVDWARKACLDRGQRRAFEIILGTFLLTFYDDVNGIYEPGVRHTFGKHKRYLQQLTERRRRDKQLICLLHGPGGSGKTAVIELVILYAKEYCSNLGIVHFNSRTIVITALTGVAATILGGETTHSAVFLNQTRPLEPEQIELWEETRLLIVDEVSFASKTEFGELDRKLRRLKQRLDVPYGGLSVIFAGDFRQLEPIGEGKKAVYKEPCPEFNEWVNCYVELDGLHRFRLDLEWGKLLKRFRDGTATLRDIEKINSRVVTLTTVLPDNLRYATYFNIDRDAINTALFEKRCLDNESAIDDSILIFSDNLKVRNGDEVYKPFRGNKLFWEHCGEDDLKTAKGAGRVDPVLRLYKGCRVMLPANMDVKNGQANGTQAVVEGVVLKHGTSTRDVCLDGNIIVKGICASDVSHVVLRHLNRKITPTTFNVVAREHTFRAKVPMPTALQTKKNDCHILRMKATQLGLLVNNATTGHKLQGSGVDNLFVHSWSNVTNWVYVMLSRVTTLKGLFLRQPLCADLRKYQMPRQLESMIDSFRQHSPTYWPEEHYAEMFDA